MERLQGKTALVTGAAHPKGIGFAIARMFAEKGARIIISDIDGDNLETAKQTLAGEGHDVSAYEFDVSRYEEVRETMERMLDEAGTIDILVNNVGGSTRITREELASTHQQLKPKSFLGVTNVEMETWRKIMDVNLNSVLYCSRMVIPRMIEQRYGRIVNIASIVGRQGVNKHEPFSSGPYAVAKAGVIGLTRQLALELGEFGVTVNCIAPGIILSSRGEKAQQSLDEAGFRRLTQRVALERLGEPGEIASVAYSLCSDMFSYVTGQTIDANGGMYFS